MDTTRSNGCACWIRNTVDDALEAFEEIQKQDPEIKVHLFHARLAMCDRLAVEKNVLSWFGKDSLPADRDGRILVATQVVEQSLDLDFDFMVTDLAPMDLIIQRAGRLWRHDRSYRPTADRRLMVYGPAPAPEVSADWYASFFCRAAYVYKTHASLWLTASRLAAKGEINLPAESRALIEDVYGQEEVCRAPKAITQRDLPDNGQKSADRSLAKLNCLDPFQGYEFRGHYWQEDTPTRLGDPVSILRLAHWDGLKLIPWSERDDRLAWPLSQVTVRRTLVAEEEPPDPVLDEAMKKARANMPDQGGQTLLVPLVPETDGNWTGLARDGNNRTILLKYRPETGLRVIR